MKSFAALFLFFVLLVSQTQAQTGKGKVIFADAVYHNGKIVTVDERFSVVQALASERARSWLWEATAKSFR